MHDLENGNDIIRSWAKAYTERNGELSAFEHRQIALLLLKASTPSHVATTMDSKIIGNVGFSECIAPSRTGSPMTWARMRASELFKPDVRVVEADFAAELEVCLAAALKEESAPSATATREKPPSLGHNTRMSDSSVYDEVCMNCGATDARGDDRLEKPCPAGSLKATDGGTND